METTKNCFSLIRMISVFSANSTSRVPLTALVCYAATFASATVSAFPTRATRRVEVGENQLEANRGLQIAVSTIKTNLKNTKKIKPSALSTTSLMTTMLICSRSSLLEEKMENRLRFSDSAFRPVNDHGKGEEHL